MKKQKAKLTIDHMKNAFLNIPCGTEFSRTEIVELVTALYGDMEVLPSDYCYNRVNNGIDLEKHIKENRCLFEYLSRNRYKYIGAGQPYSGDIVHQPKASSEHIVGRVNNGVVEWYK